MKRETINVRAGYPAKPSLLVSLGYGGLKLADVLIASLHQDNVGWDVTERKKYVQSNWGIFGTRS